MNQPLCLHQPRRRAFTLLELLTVIGIITILIAILVPVISKVRSQSYSAANLALLNQITGAIERYKTDNGAYPGPLPNSAFNNGVGPSNLTMTENMVVGLAGGWEPGGTINLNNVGKGAMTHIANVNRRSRLQVYLDPTPGQMVQNQPWANTGKIANDSTVPEFMDRFPEGRPILYMRANVSAVGITGTDNTVQYNLSQLYPYDEVFKSNPPPPVKGGSPEFASWDRYFMHPTIPNTPKSQNTYLLISAGPDNIFGTKDDQLSTGGPG